MEDKSFLVVPSWFVSRFWISPEFLHESNPLDQLTSRESLQSRLVKISDSFSDLKPESFF